MPQPVLTWAIELNPSEKKTFEITSMADLKITAATLDPVLKDQNGRSTVILHITHSASKDSDDEEESDEDSVSDSDKMPPTKVVLTSLTPGKTESMLLDTIITRPATVVGEVIGKNTIHLSGYLYVPDNEMNPSDSDEDYPGGGLGLDDDYDSDEELSDGMEYDLEPDDSELGEMGQEIRGLLKDSGRFEEVNDEDEESETEKPAKEAKKPAEGSKKRARESDEDEPVPKLSKKQQKKLKAQQAAAEAGSEKKTDAPPQKKQKAEDGTPVAVPPTKKGEPTKEVNGGAATTSKKEKEKAKGEKKEKEKSKSAGDGKDASAGKTVKAANGLSMTDSKIGTGATAKNGSRLSMRYIGKLNNGTVFDSNTNGRPFQFRLGKGEVIKGWDQGLLGMKVGGERLLVIPPNLGYGKQKTGGIPPNSTLTFEVKLLEIS